jgi:isopentenyldiphosphate isomerase
MTEQTYPNITAVNEHDEVVGYLQLFDAIAQGLLRRVSCIFVLDEHGRILIQRRSLTVLHPNLLDFSAAGHVNEGDDYLTAAASELYEELAVKDVVLTLLTAPFPTPSFYNAIYKTVVPKDTEFKINEDEVLKIFWVSLSELEEMIARHPQQFTEPFLAVWPHVRDKIIV